MASVLAMRLLPIVAMTVIVSSSVNQFTLLIGTLPVVYSLGLGHPGALPFGERQTSELLLTGAQALFAIVLLSNLKFTHRGAWALFILFITQLSVAEVHKSHLFFALAYLIMTLSLLAFDRSRLKGSLVLIPMLSKWFMTPAVLAATVLLVGLGVGLAVAG